MNLPLIIGCAIIVFALIIFPLIVSYKEKKKDKNRKNEWDQIKENGNNLNNKTREKY